MATKFKISSKHEEALIDPNLLIQCIPANGQNKNKSVWNINSNLNCCAKNCCAVCCLCYVKFRKEFFNNVW